MKTTIYSKVPMTQDIEVTCNYHKEWDAYLFNIYAEESYPDDDKRRPIGEEVTLSFTSQEEVEQFINLIRRATKKIKPEKRDTKVSSSRK